MNKDDIIKEKLTELNSKLIEMNERMNTKLLYLSIEEYFINNS